MSQHAQYDRAPRRAPRTRPTQTQNRKPAASRKESREVYIVAKDFKG